LVKFSKPTLEFTDDASVDIVKENFRVLIEGGLDFGTGLGNLFEIGSCSGSGKQGSLNSKFHQSWVVIDIFVK